MIYAIGTSHTYGKCRGQTDGKLPITWCEILEEKLDHPVINYGRAGVSNIQLIEMAEDICKNKNPDMIIAEMRWTIHPILIEDHFRDPDNTDLYAQTRAVDEGRDKYSSRYRAMHYGMAKHVDNLEQRLERAMTKPNDKWWLRYGSDFIENLKGHIKISFLHNVFYDQYKRQALSNFYHLQSICDRYNVPLKIFVWTASNYADVSESNFDMSGLSTFEFFKDGKTFIESAGDWVYEHQCECEHFKTPVHEYFVDTVIDEIRECL